MHADNPRAARGTSTACACHRYSNSCKYLEEDRDSAPGSGAGRQLQLVPRLSLVFVLVLNVSEMQELIDLHESGLAHLDSITAKPTPLKWSQNPGSQKTLRSSADATKQALLDNAVRHPQSAQARQLIAAAYGVAGPPSALARSGLERDMLLATAAMKTGLCTQHGMLLNRSGHCLQCPDIACNNL